MAENKTHTYKEKRGRSNILVPGYGTSNKDGLIVTTNPVPLENPNFQLVENTVTQPTTTPAPAATNSAPVNTNVALPNTNSANATPVAPAAQAQTKE